MLVHLRGPVVEEERSNRDPEALAMRATAAVSASRRPCEAAQRLARRGAGPLARLPPGPAGTWTRMRDLPEVPERSFRDWWELRR